MISIWPATPGCFYLLWASQGEYSDRSEWPIAIYDNKETCEAAVLRGEALFRELCKTAGHDYARAKRAWASEKGAELKAIVGCESLSFWDDLTLTCCELEVRTASAIEAATAGETVKQGSTEGESAVPKADAQPSVTGITES